MIDFSDPSFAGEGRLRPPGRPNPKRGTDSLSDLNITSGTRIRVLKDNDKRGLVGLEGVVVQSIPGSVIVQLEADPMIKFRSNQATGFAKPTVAPKRFFRVTEVERI